MTCLNARPAARTFSAHALVASLLIAASLSCSDDVANNTGGGTGTGASGTGASAPGGGPSGGPSGGSSAGGAGGAAGGAGGAGGVQQPTEPAPCQGTLYECGDLVDNDADGLLDALDPDCLGPCDNTEDSYFPDLPSNTNNSCKLDCYWDAGDGSGDDNCYWSHECDPNNVDPDFFPTPWLGDNCQYVGMDGTINPPGQTCGELFVTQTAQCLDFCGPLTPNGCDCFGCCELPAQSGKFVFVGSVGANEDTTCTLADVENPDICHPCEPVEACLNDCDKCEICVGQPEPDPSCNEGGGGAGGGGFGGGGSGEQCPDGVPTCGLAGQAPCAANFVCITGCCYPVPQ